MSLTEDELGPLRATVEGTLGTDKPDAVPQPDPHWRAAWSELVAVGITGFCAAEEAGGFGLRADAAATTAAALGAAVHGSPFAGLTAAARALTAADPADPLAAALVAGDAVVAWGRVAPDGGARVVDGAAEADALVLHDVGAGELLVLEDRHGWSVGTEHRFDTSRRCVDISVTGPASRRMPAEPVAVSLFGLLLAADTLGCVERSLARTVAYAGARRAFGTVIGGFQTVQHRLVDHAVRTRGMALLVAEAARRLTAGSPDARRHVAMAEVSVTSAATHILHDLLQLTGAIGFTWEYGLHHHERRAHQDARLRGNPRTAMAEIATLESWS